MLIDDADIAQWSNEGLPGDRMSIENATVLTNCDRWPLMIDPQLQGLSNIIKNSSYKNIILIMIIYLKV
jgi:dynein heavy chain